MFKILIYTFFIFSSVVLNAQTKTVEALVDSVFKALITEDKNQVMMYLPKYDDIAAVKEKPASAEYSADQQAALTKNSIEYIFKKAFKNFLRDAKSIDINVAKLVMDDKRQLIQKAEKTRYCIIEIDCHSGKYGAIIRFTGIELNKKWYLGEDLSITKRDYEPPKSDEEIEKFVEENQKKNDKKRAKAQKKIEKENQKIQKRIDKMQADSARKLVEKERELQNDSAKAQREIAKQKQLEQLDSAKKEREIAKQKMQEKIDSTKNQRAIEKQKRQYSIDSLKQIRAIEKEKREEIKLKKQEEKERKEEEKRNKDGTENKKKK